MTSEKLPSPAGWRILVKPIDVVKKTAGGIELPHEVQESLGYLRNVGQVLAMGPACYKHSKFGDTGPWCQVGDWIRYHQHSGQRELIQGADGALELRYVNDDDVLARADDPSVWVQEF